MLPALELLILFDNKLEPSNFLFSLKNVRFLDSQEVKQLIWIFQIQGDKKINLSKIIYRHHS